MTQLAPYSTPTQVAMYLSSVGVSITGDAVRRWCRDKRIPAITLPGGQYLIRREDVEAILSGQPMATADP